MVHMHLGKSFSVNQASNIIFDYCIAHKLCHCLSLISFSLVFYFHCLPPIKILLKRPYKKLDNADS